MNAPLPKPLVIHERGPRRMSLLGDNKNVLVLELTSPMLSQRHSQALSLGAGWDYPSYRPHITVGYGVPTGFKIDEIKPFDGAIELGPENHKKIDANWGKDNVPKREVAGSLIVIRDVLCPTPMYLWMQSLDLPCELENPEDLHVTIVYTRRKLRKPLIPDTCHLRNNLT